MTTLSLIIPAYNEELYLGATFEHIKLAELRVLSEKMQIDIIVVDNASVDATAEIALANGARVVPEPIRSIGRARNTGADAAAGEVIVFLDADSLVPVEFFVRIAEVMQHTDCLGGAVDLNQGSNRRWVRMYLMLWRYLGRMARMAQGAAQFCRKDTFVALGGYDEGLYMGEDVDFYWRLRRYAKQRGSRVELIEDIQVTPSPRRFEQWSAWRILIWTNPICVFLFRRRKWAWSGWYSKPIR